MISREKYLLNMLAEEASEVAQRASKAIRFGLAEKQTGQDKSNLARLVDEMIDLAAVAKMLNLPLPTRLDMNEAIAEKIAKVEKYYQYSVAIGEAAPSPEPKE